MFSESDFKTLAAKGISPEQAGSQLERFKTGFPELTVVGSATVGHGIARLDSEARAAAEKRWSEYLADGGKACKFVPASGAASRMFKSLFAFVDGPDEKAPADSDVAEVISSIPNLPFIPR